MIKKGILIIFYIVIFLNLISAIKINLIKDVYYSGETVQAEFSGNFLNKLDFINNVFLYKKGIPRPISRDGDLIEKDGIYYLYIILSQSDVGNFSIHLENIEYTSNGEYKTDPIIKDFKIKKSNEPKLSINPGFIFAKKDFFINVKSLNSGQEVNAELEASGEKFNDPLLPEDLEDNIKFSIKGLKIQKTNLKINDYNIPVFILKYNPTCTPDCSNKECGDDGCGGVCGTCLSGESCNNYKCVNQSKQCVDECLENKTQCFGNILKICSYQKNFSCLRWINKSFCEFGCLNATCLENKTNLTIINESLNTNISINKTFENGNLTSDCKFSLINLNVPRLAVRVPENEETLLQVFIENNGSKNFSNLNIFSDFRSKISPKVLNLSIGEKRIINITVNLNKSDINQKNMLVGHLFAKDNNTNISLPVYIEITLNKSKVVLTNTLSNGEEKTPKHCYEIGKKCKTGEKCSVLTLPSLEGPCCPKECQKKEKTSKWLIGLFIFLILGVLIFMIYLRIKRNPNKISTEKLLKNKTREFRKRMFNETYGSLSKA